MKRIFFLFLFFNAVLFAQNRKGELRLAPHSEAHELYVAFKPEVLLVSKDYDKEILQSVPQMEAIFSAFQLHFEQGIPISDEKFDFLATEARRLSKSDASVRKLKNILKVKIPNATNEKLMELASVFERFEAVDYCELIPLTPITPPTDIAPTTSNYEPNQVYMNSNPGIDMNYAWGLGLSGSGIRVRDVEYGFNPNHEDLNDVNVSIASGMTINSSATTAYTEHGTPVFGLIMANKGSYGISGMAYSASEMILFPEWQQSGYSRVNAISQAIANSQAGDVILFEMQAYGQSSNFVPAEFSQSVWDLTKAATDAGIIIVEAAANGNEDLDSAYYASYMARGNSGAIIVGGGKADLSHDRIWYSTYGSRIDVQGWAENVFACGYGDYTQVGGDFNQGYTYFSGTSSATPMVAACVIVLQSYYHGLTNSYLTPAEMRQLLQTTGIPQGSGVAGNIGPLPNMQSAILQIDANLGVQQSELLVAAIYPNPVNDSFFVQVPGNDKASVTLFDSLGRTVLCLPNWNTENPIQVSNLPAGVYFIAINSGDKSTTKKLVKK